MLAIVMFVTRNIDWFKITQIPVMKDRSAEQVSG